VSASISARIPARVLAAAVCPDATLARPQVPTVQVQEMFRHWAEDSSGNELTVVAWNGSGSDRPAAIAQSEAEVRRLSGVGARHSRPLLALVTQTKPFRTYYRVFTDTFSSRGSVCGGR
jgi:hypothetical protein